MDDVFISRKQAAEAMQAEHDQEVEIFGVEIPECFDAQLAIEILDSIPTTDVVSRDCFNRILAENDTMRAQLAQIGKKPGDSMDDVKRYGKWKHVKYVEDENEQAGGWWISRCTNCSMPYHSETPFCPHCGADMR